MAKKEEEYAAGRNIYSIPPHICRCYPDTPQDSTSRLDEEERW